MADRYMEGYSMLLSDLLVFVPLHYIIMLVQSNDAFNEQLPATVKWYQLMLRSPAVHYAISQLEKQQMCGVSCHRKILLSAPSKLVRDSVTSIRDATPKKSRKNSQGKCSNLGSVLDKIKFAQVEDGTAVTASIQWDQLPSAVDPSDGQLSTDRARHKRQQIENIVGLVMNLIPDQRTNTIVDFCAGGGHLGIVLAYHLPQCNIILVENKEESLSRARHRLKQLKLANVTCIQCNLDYLDADFDVGVALHACGMATDLVLDCCIKRGAHFVISPCCYGSIHNTSQICYPKSKTLSEEDCLSYEEYQLVASAGDRTDWDFSLAKGILGKRCMNIVDTDRCLDANSNGYCASLITMEPKDCSPKNNIIFGIASSKNNPERKKLQ